MYLIANGIVANGPAIKLVNVTRRPEAGEHCILLRRKWFEAGEGGYGACFCCQAVSIIEFYECRGTNESSAPNVVHGYRVILVHWCSVAVQCRIGAGCCPRLLTFLRAEAGIRVYHACHMLSNVQRIKAKTVTSLLILLSVLQVVVVRICHGNGCQIIMIWLITTGTLWNSPSLMSWSRSVIFRKEMYLT